MNDLSLLAHALKGWLRAVEPMAARLGDEGGTAPDPSSWLERRTPREAARDLSAAARSAASDLETRCQAIDARHARAQRWSRAGLLLALSFLGGALAWNLADAEQVIGLLLIGLATATYIVYRILHIRRRQLAQRYLEVEKVAERTRELAASLDQAVRERADELTWRNLAEIL